MLRSNKKCVIACEWTLDVLLLICLSVQLFVATCLLTYGSIPLPSGWINHKLAGSPVKGFYIQAENYGLDLNGEFVVDGAKLFHGRFKQPLASMDHAVIQIGFWGEGKQRFSIDAATFVGGRLFVPAVYSPNGQRILILEQIALHTRPQSGLIQIDRFAARHEGLSLRGGIEWPLILESGEGGTDERDFLDEFYRTAAELLRKKEWMTPFDEPTLVVNSRVESKDKVEVEVDLFASKVDFNGMVGKNLRLDSSFAFGEGAFVSEAPVRVRAETLSIPGYKVSVDGADLQISSGALQSAREGNYLPFGMRACRVAYEDLEVISPVLSVDPGAFPIIEIVGTTAGLEGAVSLDAYVNLAEKSGEIEMKGAVDFLTLAGEEVMAKLPELRFEGAPYYVFRARSGPGLKLEFAEMEMEVRGLRAGEVDFDSVMVAGRYEGDVVALERIWIERGEYWADLGFDVDLESKDFSLSIVGWAIPSEYNSILPRWWEVIMRDIQLYENSSGFGNFVIHGKLGNKIADSYFGHVRAKHLSYKGIHAEEAELFVRGKGMYVEIHRLSASDGDAWANGDVRFTSFPGRKPAPVSVRFDIDANLPLNAARKIFGPTIAEIIDGFSLRQFPYVEIDATVFNKHYTEYEGMNSFRLFADSRGAGSFKGLPFEYLSFNLVGADRTTSLREVKFGYAGGVGSGALDIIVEDEATLNVDFVLKGAGRDRAMHGMSQIKDYQGSEISLESDLAAEETTGIGLDNAELDLALHVSGRFGDIPSFSGYGASLLQDPTMGEIRLLGPVSTFLENTPLGFTSLSLDSFEATFSVEEGSLHFDRFRVTGPRLLLQADGSVSIVTKEIDLDVTAKPFGNVGDPNNMVRRVTDLITSPVPNLLRFNVSGTVEDQVIRSIYDPRFFF